MSSPQREHLARTGRRPTLLDVARAAGVSRSTVSNAYNRPDQLGAAVREHVLAVAADLGYAGPDPAASGLRRGRAGVLAVLLGGRLSYAFRDPATALFLDGLGSAVEDAGLALLVLPGSGRGGPRPEAVRRAVADAVISYCLPDDDPALEVARARALPLVLVDQPGGSGSASSGPASSGPASSGPASVEVDIDDRAGAAAAAGHLLALGHRRLAVVAFELAADGRTGPADLARQQAATFGVTRLRLDGYRAAVEAHGLDWSQVQVLECATNARDLGRRAARGLLAQPEPPTGILALSDELALGVLDAARDAGADVPGALSVVGFDDTPVAECASPPLTTIAQPLREKGLRAGEAVVALLDGRRPSSAHLGTRLVVRATTAPPSGSRGA